MSSSNSTGRPFTRRGRWANSQSENDAAPTAASVASQAGSLARAAVDPLEERKLLFSLTIGPGDIGPDGLGQVQADFGYFLPFFQREVPDPEDPEIIEEEFADEDGFWTNFNPPAPPSGITFNTSNILLTFDTISAIPAVLIDGDDVDPDGDPVDDSDLEISLVQTDFLGFTFLRGNEDDLEPGLALEMQLTIVGLDTDATTGTRVELLIAGDVVDTFTGAELTQARVPAQGGGFIYTFGRADGFEEIRFSSAADEPDNVTYSDTFIIDDMQATFPGGRFEDTIGERTFGARAVFTGPVGASVQFFDLYGADIIRTINLTGADRNDDGIPDFNDGIGSIVFTNADSTTKLTLLGGTITTTNDNQFTFATATSIAGFTDDFEGAGFGYGLTNDDDPEVLGLPDGGGAVVVGSPFVRDRTSTDTYFLNANNPVTQQFTFPTQGVFAQNGQSVGTVAIQGILHGQSVVDGSLGSLEVSYLPGSFSVAGDLGAVFIGSDAGLWLDDDGNQSVQGTPVVNSIGSELFVGRTLQQFHVGGQTGLDVTVLGDINNDARPAIDFLNYTERELVYSIDPNNVEEPEQFMLLTNAAQTQQQAPILGSQFYRNDSLQHAEYVGYVGAGVTISGTSGGIDPVNTSEDITDVFAFAADDGTEVVISISSFVVYARIVDADGRVLANHPENFFDDSGISTPTGFQLRFTPDHDDVYYLVLNDVADGVGSAPYTATIAGMAPTRFGLMSVAGRFGNGAAPAVINLLAGEMGIARMGVGFIDGTGAVQDTTSVTLYGDDEDEGALDAIFDFGGGGSLTVSEDLYSLSVGSDYNGGELNIGGDLGSLITGFSPQIAADSSEGDFFNGVLNIGGGVAVMDIQGGVGILQDDNTPESTGGQVTINTGTAGRGGDIGEIIVGEYIVGTGFNLNIAPGSQLDKLIVRDDGQLANTGFFRFDRPLITTGSGSNIRFIDFAQTEDNGDGNAVIQLVEGTALQFTDDAGMTASIIIEGGDGTSTGTIRIIPIDGAEGVVVARVEATLNGGADIRIVGLSDGTFEIGRLDVTTDGTTGSSVFFEGQGEIDVWQVRHLAGAALTSIVNSTIGGDIVMIDATAVDTVTIRGNLGSTQTASIGRDLIGTFRGISSGFQGGVGGAIGVSNAGFTAVGGVSEWDGSLYVPINAPANDGDGTGSLEDLGSPIDPYLNGLIVRTGNLTLLTVGGSVGDVILQGGDITELVVNDDRITPFGEFHGVTGSIYANDIDRIDVGDGLAARVPVSILQASIVADDDIGIVESTISGAFIEGGIVAGNTNAVDEFNLNNGIDGVAIVRLNGGAIRDAFIDAGAFDAFWNSFRMGGQDGLLFTGTVDAIQLSSADLQRSAIRGDSINLINIENGAYDATTLITNDFINDIIATEFLNSTLLGEANEFRENTISTLGSIRNIRATGDIADLVIRADSSLTGIIQAANIIRLDAAIASNIAVINVTNDLRASSIIGGRLESLTVGGDIRSTSVRISGPIVTVTAGGEITQLFVETTGPGGRIASISAPGVVSGEFRSSGPIDRIASTGSDLIAMIETTDFDGDVGELSAGRDLRIEGEIQGSLTTMRAGRNIGLIGEGASGRVLVIDGSVGTINASGGQVYRNLLIGGDLTGGITVGRVITVPGADLVGTPTITVNGRISQATINGDFGGSLISESGGIGSVRVLNGSLRQGAEIIARDGGIDLVSITGGHLLGSIIADDTIGQVLVLAGLDGFWGDIGVNPFLSQTIAFDGLRNQLPPGTVNTTDRDGALIQSGANIGLVRVERGSFWESSVIAGFSIGSVDVFGVIQNDTLTTGFGSFIIATDTVASVRTGWIADGLLIAAGIVDLGDDNLAGGVGANADTVRFGRIGNVTIGNDAFTVTISAGMNAGDDGIYNTADDLVANGLSSIQAVTVIGAAFNVTAFADNGIGPTSAGVVRGGPGLRQAENDRVIEFVPSTGQIATGVTTEITTLAGETALVTFTGPGLIFWDQAEGRLAIINSTSASNLRVEGGTGTLTDFTIISNDGASIGSVFVAPSLFGDSNFYFDVSVGTAAFGYIESTGRFGSGGDITTFLMGPLVTGTIDANFIQGLIIGGSVGEDATIRMLAGGGLVIAGDHRGLISVTRDLGVLQVGASIDDAHVRAGRTLGSISAGSIVDSRISTGDGIGSILVFGNVTGSDILAGGDLGADGDFGGVGENADRVTDGFINTVTINGSLFSSDIAAGALRGPDGFLGTSDDSIDQGLSDIGSITIANDAGGSSIGGESYRFLTTGSLGSVTVKGAAFNGAGNLLVSALRSNASPLVVEEITNRESSRVYSIDITFDQQLDSSTLSSALTVSEVRDRGTVLIGLAEDVDYRVSYNIDTRTATVTFSRDLSERDLPQLFGVPGPGLYRIELDAATLRGRTQNAFLDGNGDGIGSTADDYSQDVIVGDVGDKVTAGSTTLANGANVDFYAALDLDTLLDNNFVSDGLPDPNQSLEVRGVLGDHPDHDPFLFRSVGDVDLYSITLQEGQIVRLSALQGAASAANLQLLDEDGGSSGLLNLPSGIDFERFDLEGVGEQVLVQETGTYYILVSTTAFDNDTLFDTDAVLSGDVVSGTLGSYSFNLVVFQDNDTGFNGDTDAGNGKRVPDAPLPMAFAGTDDILGTADDDAAVTIFEYTFTLSAGADGQVGTADDVVSGSDGGGVTSVRTSGPDAVFGTDDDRRDSFIASAIGQSGVAGVPLVAEPDADVYHINGGELIQPGTVIRATLRLTEIGANIAANPFGFGSGLDLDFLSGFFGDFNLFDIADAVEQFAIFDTTNSTGLSDAILVAAPSDVTPIGGGDPGVIASNDIVSYGYDDRGDFFIELATPGQLGGPAGQAASYALYIQGGIRSDYQIELTTQGVRELELQSQNVLVEFSGGEIDWLEFSGTQTTQLAAFDSRTVGFDGFIGVQPINEYIEEQLITQLTDIFNAANVRVIFAGTSIAFEGDPFSTVFVAGNNEPPAFFENGRFGASQHVDPLNADNTDEAVVFAPALNVLGSQPTQDGIDGFVDSLTAAVARRVGELVGLSQTGGFSTSPMATTSVLAGLDTYRFSGANQNLAASGERAFFMGQQDDIALLDRIFADRF